VASCPAPAQENAQQPPEGLLAPPQLADDDIPFDVDSAPDDGGADHARVSFTDLGAFHTPPPNAQAEHFRDAFLTALAGAVGALEQRVEMIEARLDVQDRQRTRAKLTVIEGDKP
jgi:hypothetical protein